MLLYRSRGEGQVESDPWRCTYDVRPAAERRIQDESVKISYSEKPTFGSKYPTFGINM